MRWFCAKRILNQQFQPRMWELSLPIFAPVLTIRPLSCCYFALSMTRGTDAQKIWRALALVRPINQGCIPYLPCNGITHRFKMRAGYATGAALFDARGKKYGICSIVFQHFCSGYRSFPGAPSTTHKTNNFTNPQLCKGQLAFCGALEIHCTRA